jgi:hypothetical protein
VQPTLFHISSQVTMIRTIGAIGIWFAVILVCVDGLDYRTAAAMMGISIDGLKKHSRSGKLEAMGFWGTLVAARLERPLEELAALKDHADRTRSCADRGDGWQVGQVRGGPDDYEGVLSELMAETGHPVLGAYVLDSDSAHVVGFSPVAGRWATWLQLERAVRLEVEPPMRFDGRVPRVDERDPGYLRQLDEHRRRLLAVGSPAEQAAPNAIRWAREAGYSVPAEPVLDVMRGSETFVEDLFFRLLDALGVP